MHTLAAYHTLLKLTGEEAPSIDRSAVAGACVLAARRGLGPLALHALERHGLTDALPVSDLEALRAQRRTAVARYRMWGIILADDLGALGAAVEMLLLKGAALGHTVYPHPWLRSAGDVDLLVREEQAERGYRTLEGLGYRLQPAHSEVHGPGAAKTLSNGDRLWIELHTRIAPRRLYPTLSEEAIWAETMNITAWGRPFRCPSLGVSILQSAIHLARTLGDGCVGPKRVIDIRHMVAAPGYVPGRAEELAAEAGARRLLLLATRLADLAPPSKDRGVEAVVGRLTELLEGPHRGWKRLAWDIRAAGLLDRPGQRLGRQGLALARRVLPRARAADADDD